MMNYFKARELQESASEVKTKMHLISNFSEENNIIHEQITSKTGLEGEPRAKINIVDPMPLAALIVLKYDLEFYKEKDQKLTQVRRFRGPFY